MKSLYSTGLPFNQDTRILLNGESFVVSWEGFFDRQGKHVAGYVEGIQRYEVAIGNNKMRLYFTQSAILFMTNNNGSVPA